MAGAIRHFFKQMKDNIMKQKYHTLFISDLHLDESRKEITDIFLRFLKEIAPKADALYILGDFFEAYIGDDDPSPLIRTINTALREATDAGLPIYFLPGNRDFMVGNEFSKQTGVTCIPDPTVITAYNERILLMHGDSLCTLDHKHQRFRRITSWKWLQTLFLNLPIQTRQKIGEKMRSSSQTQRPSPASQAIMDVTPSAVITAMKKHQVKRLIHGHTHRPNIHQFEIDHQNVERVVLSDWHNSGHYLVLFEDNTLQSIYYPGS